MSNHLNLPRQPEYLYRHHIPHHGYFHHFNEAGRSTPLNGGESEASFISQVPRTTGGTGYVYRTSAHSPYQPGGDHVSERNPPFDQAHMGQPIYSREAMRHAPPLARTLALRNMSVIATTEGTRSPSVQSITTAEIDTHRATCDHVDASYVLRSTERWSDQQDATITSQSNNELSDQDKEGESDDYSAHEPDLFDRALDDRHSIERPLNPLRFDVEGGPNTDFRPRLLDRDDDTNEGLDYKSSDNTCSSPIEPDSDIDRYNSRYEDLYTGTPCLPGHDSSYISPCPAIPNGSSFEQIILGLPSQGDFNPSQLPPRFGMPDHRAPPFAIRIPRTVYQAADEAALRRDRTIGQDRAWVQPSDFLLDSGLPELGNMPEISGLSLSEDSRVSPLSDEAYNAEAPSREAEAMRKAADRVRQESVDFYSQIVAQRLHKMQQRRQGEFSRSTQRKEHNDFTTASSISDASPPRFTSAFNPAAAPYTPSKVKQETKIACRTHDQGAAVTNHSEGQIEASLEVSSLPRGNADSTISGSCRSQQRPRLLSEAARRRAALDQQIAQARAETQRLNAKRLLWEKIQKIHQAKADTARKTAQAERNSQCVGKLDLTRHAIHSSMESSSFECGFQNDSGSPAERTCHKVTVSLNTPKRPSKAIAIKTPAGQLVSIREANTPSNLSTTPRDIIALTTSLPRQPPPEATLEELKAHKEHGQLIDLVGPHMALPLFEVAMLPRHMPFVTSVMLVEEPSKDNSQLTGMVKISNMPYSVTRQEIIAFCGRNARLAKIPENIHIILERMTSKTMDCYVEFDSHRDAWEAVNRQKLHRNKLGNRTPDLQVVGHEVFLAALFSKTYHVKWIGGYASIVPHNISLDSKSVGFQGFVMKEELIALVKTARLPRSTSFANHAPQRIYECMITTLDKFPWYHASYITIEDRDRLFACTIQLIKELNYCIGRDGECNNINRRLAFRLETAAFRCPGFSVCQLAELAEIALTPAKNSLWFPNSDHYDAFRTIGVKKDVSIQVLQYYQALIRSVVPGTGHNAHNIFGNLEIKYPHESERLSLLETTQIEWTEIMRVLRLALPDARLSDIMGHDVLAILAER